MSQGEAQQYKGQTGTHAPSAAWGLRLPRVVSSQDGHPKAGLGGGPDAGWLECKA